MKNKSVKNIAMGGVIAALYVVLTLLSHMLGLAGGQIQLRLSEALGILPAFTPAAVPGLFVGCLLANILTGAMLPDVIFGSLATLLAAVLTRFFTRKMHSSRAASCAAVLPPVLCNTAVIPLVLFYGYGIGPYLFNLLTVFAGEVISAGVLGILLYPVMANIFSEIQS